MVCNLYYPFTTLGDPHGNIVIPLKDIISEVEKMHILEALEVTNWVKARAAKRLGISQSMLAYKIKKYEIIIKPRGGKEDEKDGKVN